MLAFLIGLITVPICIGTAETNFDQMYNIEIDKDVWLIYFSVLYLLFHIIYMYIAWTIRPRYSPLN